MKHSLVYDSSIIESGCFRFVITAAPCDSKVDEYCEHLKEFDTRLLIQVCEPNIYSTEVLEAAGIEVHNWNFPDGSLPPARVITKWVALLRTLEQHERARTRTEVGGRGAKPTTTASFTMALHCVAGLGRAPLLVAIALIEGGMTPLKSIEYIRRRRQGAFNSKQLRWLLKYKKTTDEGCTIL